MKYTLLALSFLYLFTSFGQCDYKINETDKFTGVKKIETKDQKVYYKSGHFIEMAFGKSDSLIYTKLHIGMTGKPFFISGGDETSLIFIFNGGSTMELSLRTSSGVATKLTNTSWWVVDAKYYLNESEFYQLQKKRISGIRLYTSQGYIENEEVKSKFAAKIVDLAKCIE